MLTATQQTKEDQTWEDRGVTREGQDTENIAVRHGCRKEKRLESVENESVDVNK